jgi:hypothetical protein
MYRTRMLEIALTVVVSILMFSRPAHAENCGGILVIVRSSGM